jgi:8-oxo-dGTP pyrophosphatase MutT (NUDIX family)
MNASPTRHYTAAGGIVMDADARRVLVLRRPGRLGPDGAPEMRLPKGHVEPGESHREAAQREVQEEAGLANLNVITGLGHQRVSFDLEGERVIRDEYYYLMAAPAGIRPRGAESQFEPLWLSWQEALQQVSFDAEREWLRRARAALPSQ